MEKSDSLPTLLQRIRSIMPDLEIKQVVQDEEGLINDIVIINREVVFRFARDERGARLLQLEMKILDLVRPRISINIPDPIYRSDDCMVYRFLDGQPLTRKLLLGFDEQTLNEIAGQLGAFLYELHSIDISNLDWELPATLAPVTRQRWLDLQARVKEKIYPYLLKSQVQWADDLFGSILEDPQNGQYQPVLIHGDLAPYHIFIDEPTRRITGVIDLGVAGRGDAASDIGGLINIYGESFVSRMRSAYPDLNQYLPRARFYAQLLELQWVLLGLETGETFWFTAHLGNARDIYA